MHPPWNVIIVSESSLQDGWGDIVSGGVVAPSVECNHSFRVITPGWLG